VPLALVYTSSEAVQGSFGDQVRYNLADGRIIYLDAAIGMKIAQAGIGPNVPFTVLKQRDGKQTKWQIWRDADNGATGSHPAAPRVQPLANGCANTPEHIARPMPAAGNGAGQGSAPAAPPPGPAVHQGNFQYLIEQTQGLIDAYGALLKYASDRHGNSVKPDDVRALLTTMFINVTGKGGVR
jgi:hypothetical protein